MFKNFGFYVNRTNKAEMLVQVQCVHESITILKATNTLTVALKLLLVQGLRQWRKASED